MIPESYYITDISSKAVVPQYYQVKYCGMDFYFKAETRPSTSTVTFQDGVSPSPDLRLTLKAESLQLSGVEITADYGLNITDETQRLTFCCVKAR